MKVFQIQLPIARNDGENGDTACVIGQIVDITGGVTSTRSHGQWKDATGIVIHDTVLNVQTYATNAQIPSLIARVPAWREILDQDALVYAVWDAEVGFRSKAFQGTATVEDNISVKGI